MKKNKYIFLLPFILLSFLILPQLSIGQEVDCFRLEAGLLNGQVGDEICVPIKVYNIENIKGFNYNMTWNPEVLSFQDSVITDMDDLWVSYNIEEGQLAFNWFNVSNQAPILPNGSTIYELCFEVLDNTITEIFETSISFYSQVSPIEAIDTFFQPTSIITIDGGFKYSTDLPINLTLNEACIELQNCNNLDDANIQITPENGTSPYAYLWATESNAIFSTEQNPNNLSQAIYYLTIEDADFNTRQGIFNVVQEKAFIHNAFISNVSCNGGNDGFINLSIAEGIYTFEWSLDGTVIANTKDISTLSTGTYTVFVTDENGCIHMAEYIVNGPSPMQVIVLEGECEVDGENSGFINIGVTGGMQPYTYTWSDNNNTTNQDPTGLNAGFYQVTVIDALDCTFISAPIQLCCGTLTVSNDTFLCAGEDLQLEVSYSGDATFEWSPSEAFDDPISASPIVSNIQESATYTVNVTTAEGCVYVKEIDVNVLFSESFLSLEVSVGVGETDSMYVIPPFANPLPYYLDETTINCGSLNGAFVNFELDQVTNQIYYEGVANGIDSICVQICIALPEYPCCYDLTFIVYGGDVVWPGDTDTSGVVNNFDLLNIGLAYDSIGPLRPNASLNWIGQIAPDWAQTTPSTNINYKHIDCDGNGVINSDDTLAIALNWGEMHNFIGTGSDHQFTNIPSASDAAMSPFYVEPTEMMEGETYSLPLILGLEDDPIEDFYGIAFSILYNPEVVIPNSVNAKFENSWLGTKNQNMITIQRNFPSEGRIDIAITRIDGLNITGSGEIGQVEITIEDDIFFWGGTDSGSSLIEEDLDAYFSIENVLAITFQEEEIPLAPMETVSTIIDLSTNVSNIDLAELIQCFPIPAKNELNILASNLIIESVELLNVAGQSVLHKILNKQIAKLNIEALSSGTYFLKIQTKEGMLTKKINVIK